MIKPVTLPPWAILLFACLMLLAGMFWAQTASRADSGVRDQLSALEQRLEKQESAGRDTTLIVQQFMALYRESISNQNEAALSMATEMAQQAISVSNVCHSTLIAVAELIASSNLPPRVVYSVPAPQSQSRSGAGSQAMRDGIPLAAWNAIAANAAKRWPDDFDMRAYEIKKQVAAYKSVR